MQADDVELFQNIIHDLFPSVTVPDQDHGVLEKAIHDVLQERGLQCPAPYVTKVRAAWCAVAKDVYCFTITHALLTCPCLLPAIAASHLHAFFSRLQPHHTIHLATQIIQLYDTMDVRFGVVIVGPSGGGKSECYRTLQGALTHLRTNLNSQIDAHQASVECAALPLVCLGMLMLITGAAT